jgi:hypothetical protein
MGARRTSEKPAPVDDDPDRVLPRLLYDLRTL